MLWSPLPLHIVKPELTGLAAFLAGRFEAQNERTTQKLVLGIDAALLTVHQKRITMLDVAFPYDFEHLTISDVTPALTVRVAECTMRSCVSGQESLPTVATKNLVRS